MGNISRNSFAKMLVDYYEKEFKFQFNNDKREYIREDSYPGDCIKTIIQELNIKLNKNDYDIYNEKKNPKGRLFHIGSSMRFCILALHEIKYPEIQFEYSKIGIDNINRTHPHYDCHFILDDDEFFIEAKCMELFDNNVFDNQKEHKKLSNVYINFFNEKVAKNIGLHNGINEKDWQVLSYRDFIQNFDKDVQSPFEFKHSFDLKQFLCHLMGLISHHHRCPEKNIKFCYLIYKNDNVSKKTINEYNYFKNQINAVYRVFKQVLQENQIELSYLFYDKFESLENLEQRIILSDEQTGI